MPGAIYDRSMNRRMPGIIAPILVTIAIMIALQPGIGYISASDRTEAGDPVEIEASETAIPNENSSQAVLPESNVSPIAEPAKAIAHPDTSTGQLPAYSDKQWALDRINISALWQNTRGNPEVLVAVLDTGINTCHEDLHGQIAAEARFVDSPSCDDKHGHGTHIAGIIASHENGWGATGVAPESRLLNVKVADDTGKCKASDLSEGITWAADNGASVINISIEISEKSGKLEEAINYAWNEGCLVIGAAGNDGSQSPVYPAAYENCVAVAATDRSDTLALLSNHGEWVDMAAPGSGIYSTLPDNHYGHKTGTSFACAHVSGAAALLFDILVDTDGNGRLNDEVREALENGCQAINIEGTGNGLLDAASVTSTFDSY